MDDSNRLLAFWALFDAIWAAESGIVQYHSDARRRSTAPPYAVTDVDEDLLALEQSRRSLLEGIFRSHAPNISPKTLSWLDLLGSTLLDSDDGANDLWRLTNTTSDSQDSALCRPGSDLAGSLRALLSWINHRSIQIWNSNKELEVVAHDFQKSVTSWIQNVTVIENEDQRKQLAEDSSLLYIVGCPALHPVPKRILQDALRGVDKLGYEVRVKPVI
jgi:hypothetical protein